MIPGPGVVIGRKGTLGTTFYLPDDYWPHDTTLWVKDFKGSLPRFVYYFFVSLDVKRLDVGSANPTLNRNHVHPLPVRWPERSEQERIAAVLGALDDKIAVNDRISNTSFELAESSYKQLTARATRSKPVGDLLDLRYGKALPTADRVAGNISVYGSGGVTGRHDQALAAGPGIIIGRKGTVGAVHWSEEDFFPIDTTFYVELRYAAMSMEFTFFMLRDLGLNTMNSDSAVPGLNRGNALALTVRLPGETDLQNFYKSVRPIFALRQTLSAESVALAELRGTLLPRLMSGAVRIRDAEKIVGEVS